MNKRELTPEEMLFQACEVGNIELVKELLSTGVNVNAKKT
jgi:hypothetical protein